MTKQTEIYKTVDPLNYPLLGSSFIEASAGTGKTWTIAALYVRLVLGHNCPQPRLPEEILVLTFTKAAARELKDRIRKRLLEAAAVFLGANITDEFLIELKNSIDSSQHKKCAKVLNMAAQSMDLAAISTIHSWCDRVLRQHAFDSGSLFEQELTQDTSKQQHYAAWDYWRSHIISLPFEKYQQVAQVWPGPSAINNLVKNVSPDDLPNLEGTNLAELIDGFYVEKVAYINKLKEYWRIAGPELLDWFDQLGKNLKRNSDFKRWANSIISWANDSDQENINLTKDAWDRLTVQNLLEKYKNDDLDVIDAYKSINDLKVKLKQTPELKTILYKHAFTCLSKSLKQNLIDSSLLDFDSLLIEMDVALEKENSHIFAATLRKQFPVVLIDEFQDTDPIQYSIFNKIYQISKNNQDTTVVFIGDPKQSIYKFRGADIYTYLQSLDDCAGRVYTLNKNYRSSRNMVTAVNEIFSFANKPVFITANPNQSIGFNKVYANDLDEVLIIDGKPAVAVSGLYLEGDKAKNIENYRLASADICANKIAQLLMDPKRTVIKNKENIINIKAADIAVLVGKLDEAKLMQKSLAALGVRSVYLSEKTSVYDSQQAQEFKFLLIACNEPQNSKAVFTALACPALGINHEQLLKIKDNERAWDIYVDRFIKYKEIWRYRGVLPMFYNLLHDFNIAKNLLINKYTGERSLTNFLHLADLLQNAAVKLDGSQALIDYLNTKIENSYSDESSLLRLESDESLVKITTIHKSKGLEYPIVFLPFISAGTSKKTPNLPVKFGRQWEFSLNDDLVNDYFSDGLGEEIRKLYVAVTRAKHAVWLGLKEDSDKRICGLSYVLENQTDSSFTSLCASNPTCFDVERIDIDRIENNYIVTESDDNRLGKTLRVLKNPVINDSWWIASYSALQLGVFSGYQSSANDDYLNYSLLEDQIELKSTLVETQTVDDLIGQQQSLNIEPNLLNIPIGSSTGTFLHSLLQLAAKDNFADLGNLKEKITRRCIVRGWQEHADDLYLWLTGFINNQWHINNTDFKFSNLKSSYPELEFLMPVHKLNATAIDDLITSNFYPKLSRPKLTPQILNGMFKGYIDLCFENQDGKFYIVDYKSNYLGDEIAKYSDKNLLSSMLHMRYDVQMILYTLVLHKQLKARLADYNYERDFGGAIYMYLRGQNAPNQGLVSYKPNLRLLEQLEDLYLFGEVYHNE